MFIDVTRYGGLRTLRLAIAAIAYIDAVKDGASIHLIGGEALRVNEDPVELELRVLAVSDTIQSASVDTVAPEDAPPSPQPAPRKAARKSE